MAGPLINRITSHAIQTPITMFNPGTKSVALFVTVFIAILIPSVLPMAAIGFSGRKKQKQFSIERNLMKNKIFHIYLLVAILALFNTQVYAAKKISAGKEFSLILESDNTVWSCGANYFGQLGDGATSNKKIPAQINDFSNVSNISGGGSHSLSIKSDKSTWVWGYNYQGQLGDGTNSEKKTPEQITLTDVSLVASGEYHSLALKTDNTVWAWGYNGNGQLGTETTTSTINTPIQVNIDNVTSVAAGDHHSLALKSDGTVWAWGYNLFGQLGNSFTTTSTSPVQVSELGGVTAIASGGYFSLALKSDGTVWTWGNNDYGQLGNGTNNMSSTPVQVSDLSDIIAIASGSFHGMALKSDGTVWAWGYNDNGQLGIGSNTNSLTPVQVSSLTDVSAIDGGGCHSIAIKSDGTIWVWGDNDYGQLGDESTSDRNTPVQMHIGNYQSTPTPTPTPEVVYQSPTVTTNSATNIETYQATLNGTVNTNGTTTTAWFGYGTSNGYYTGTSTIQTLSESGDVNVSTTISSLSPDTNYYYKLFAQNGTGTASGSEVSFTTDSEVVSTPTPTPTPTSGTNPAPTPEPTPQPVASPEPTITSTPTPTPTPEPTLEPEPSATPTTEPEPSPIPTIEVVPSPEPEEGCTVYGFVVDSDENPISDVTVEIYKHGALYKETTTDEYGYYEFANIDSGNYTLSVEKGGYSMEATLFEIDEDETEEIETIVLDAFKYSTTGYVTNKSGQPLKNCEIRLRGLSVKFRGKTTSDEDGFFEFGDLSSGQYMLTVRKTGYRQVVKKFTTDADTELEITLKKKK